MEYDTHSLGSKVKKDMGLLASLLSEESRDDAPEYIKHRSNQRIAFLGELREETASKLDEVIHALLISLDDEFKEI